MNDFFKTLAEGVTVVVESRYTAGRGPRFQILKVTKISGEKRRTATLSDGSKWTRTSKGSSYEVRRELLPYSEELAQRIKEERRLDAVCNALRYMGSPEGINGLGWEHDQVLELHQSMSAMGLLRTDEAYKSQEAKVLAEELRSFCRHHGPRLRYQVKDLLGDKLDIMYEAMVRFGAITPRATKKSPALG